MTSKIFANHAHVFPQSVNPEGTIDRLLRLLDACGIEQAVCFAPFPHQLTGTGIRCNTWLADQLKNHLRLYGFGTLDLTRADVKDQVAAIADLGMRGIKMHPNAQKFDILCPAALDAYAAAEQKQLFITFHKFDEVACQFPDLNFSLEHVGGYAFFHEALAVITNHILYPPIPGTKCHVYGGLTSIFKPDFIPQWYLSPERMKVLLAQVGPEQLIFGLDFPYNLEDYIHAALRVIDELQITAEQKQRVLGGNLREVLRV
jgi:hypothetical protein